MNTVVPRWQRWAALLTAGLLLVGLTACGALNPTLVVVNNTGEDLCELYVGDDQNRISDPVPDGESFSVDVEAGTYDLRALTCGGIVAEQAGQVLEAGEEITWTLSELNPSLQLINESTEAVCVLQVAEAGSGEWSDNLLGDSPVAAGDTHTVELTVGTYDLYAETCDSGTPIEDSNIEFGSGQANTWTITTE